MELAGACKLSTRSSHQEMVVLHIALGWFPLVAGRPLLECPGSVRENKSLQSRGILQLPEMSCSIVQ